MDEILRRLGKRIQEIRIRRGFKSQEEFADYCKLHRTFVGHLETGRKDFRLSSIIRVAEALGVTMQELFAGIEADKSFKAKGTSAQFDSAAILREIEGLEEGLQRLKRIAASTNPQRDASRRSQKRP